MDDADVVEDLERAWLKPLAARAVERRRRGVDEPERDGSPRQLASQGEPGGAGPRDQDLQLSM